jgi:hypothetical protein
MANSLIVICPDRTPDNARSIPAARAAPQADNRVIAASAFVITKRSYTPSGPFIRFW